MAEKNINSRIVHKHDTEAHWDLATGFIPRQGELIVYDTDSLHSYERFKIGDGITTVNNLPFTNELENLGIYIGDTEPTDPNIKIWINTAEDWTGTVINTTRLVTISLPASSWTGSNNPWKQVVTIQGITSSSKIDLQPSVQQIVDLQNDEITLVVENNAGVVTVYAIGNKPTVDYAIQAQITDVASVLAEGVGF